MTVYLVGAGPGDPGLLTVRARELIQAADVILYDRLIPPGVLDGVSAELVYVGKQGGGPQMPQEEIDRLLVQYGTGGRTVVRLKGGDPFVFGRGGEEALVLREAGIPYEVVPGVTAGIAAPAARPATTAGFIMHSPTTYGRFTLGNLERSWATQGSSLRAGFRSATAWRPASRPRAGTR